MKLTRRQLRRLMLEAGVTPNSSVSAPNNNTTKKDDSLKSKIVFPKLKSKLTDEINLYFNDPLNQSDAIFYGSILDNSQITKLKKIANNLEENVKNIITLCDKNNKHMNLGNKNYRFMLNKTADNFFATFRNELQNYLKENWPYRPDVIAIRNNGTQRDFKAASSATSNRVAGTNHGLKLANDVMIDIALPEADSKIPNYDFIKLKEKYGIDNLTNFLDFFEEKHKAKLKYIESLIEFKKGFKKKKSLLSYYNLKPVDYIKSINDIDLKSNENFLKGTSNKSFNKTVKRLKTKSKSKAKNFIESILVAKKIYAEINRINRTVSDFYKLMDNDIDNISKEFDEIDDYQESDMMSAKFHIYSTGKRNNALARNKDLVKLINKFIQDKYKDSIVWGASWDGKKGNDLSKGNVRPGSRGELEFHHFELTPRKSAEIINQDPKLKNALSLIKKIKDTGYGSVNPLEIDFNIVSFTGNSPTAMDNRRNLYLYCLELSDAYYALTEKNELAKINSLIKKINHMIDKKKVIFISPEDEEEILLTKKGGEIKKSTIKESLIRSLIRKKLKRYYT